MTKVMPLPPTWCLSSLSEVASSCGGGTPSKSDAAFWTDGSIPWVSPKDMKTFHVVSSEDKLTPTALGRLSLVPPDSVLVVVRSGILSRTLPVALNKIAVTINQDMRAFIPKPGVSASYVAWQLMAREREILSACSKHGTTVASIEGSALAQFPLVMAPTAEQDRIVAKLEELLSDLDAGVSELKTAQKKLRQYRQSLLKAAVEGALTTQWREVQRKRNTPTETGAQLLQRILVERRERWEAGQLAKFKVQGKAPPKDWQKKYPEPARPETTGLPELPEGWAWASVDQLSQFVRNGISDTPNPSRLGYPILRINAVRPMSVDMDEVKHIQRPESEVVDYLLEVGDLLATRYNGSVDLLGVFGLVRSCATPTVHPDKLIRMKPVLEGVLGRWLEIAANTGPSRAHIVSRVKTTAGQTGISGEDLKKMPVPLPSLEEQGNAASVIDQWLVSLREQALAIEISLKQSEAQRKKILMTAFSGQLVPQDLIDEPASELLERIRSELSATADMPKMPRLPRRKMCRTTISVAHGQPSRGSPGEKE